jgi:hypothetical protein
MIQVEAIAALLRDDLDGDGEITESDFVLLMLTKLKSKPEPYVLKLLRAQFCVLDATGDGTLTKAVGRVCACCACLCAELLHSPSLSSPMHNAGPGPGKYQGSPREAKSGAGRNQSPRLRLAAVAQGASVIRFIGEQ